MPTGTLRGPRRAGRPSWKRAGAPPQPGRPLRGFSCAVDRVCRRQAQSLKSRVRRLPKRRVSELARVSAVSGWIDGLGCAGAAGLNMGSCRSQTMSLILFRRTRQVGVRAEYAAIALFGLECRLTACAFVDDHTASVGIACLAAIRFAIRVSWCRSGNDAKRGPWPVSLNGAVHRSQYARTREAPSGRPPTR
jgi:hypothetical protein